MSMFSLKSHRVKEAAFLENFGKKMEGNMSVGMEGNILIPKDQDKDVAVKLKLKLGGRDERMFLTLETITVFDVLEHEEALDEKTVRKACLPLAMAKLRDTVREVSAAYGMQPPLEMPPFQEEAGE